MQKSGKDETDLTSVTDAIAIQEIQNDKADTDNALGISTETFIDIMGNPCIYCILIDDNYLDEKG